MNGRIHFPITVTQKFMSDTKTLVLNKDDEVRCYYCEEVIPVKGNVVCMGMHEAKAIRCPKCRKAVSVLYYFDRVVKPRGRK